MGYQPIYQKAKLGRALEIGPQKGRILTDIIPAERPVNERP